MAGESALVIPGYAIITTLVLAVVSTPAAVAGWVIKRAVTPRNTRAM
jgi:hypothetical protein